jgi:hypothetical protein
MARSLENKPNVDGPDSDYPFARIRNKQPGILSGTPVTEEVYGDMHQFFAKMFFESGLSYNEIPDNDYSGFQFYEALIKVIREKAFIKSNIVFAMKASEALIGTTSHTFVFSSGGIDPDGILNISNGRFTPPIGFHKVSFGVTYTPTDNPSGTIALNIFKNGVLLDTIIGDTLSGNNQKNIGFSDYVIEQTGTDYYTIVVTSSSMDVDYTSARLTIETVNNLMIV